MTTQQYPPINYDGARKVYKDQPGNIAALTDVITRRLVQSEEWNYVNPGDLGFALYTRSLYLKLADIDSALHSLVAWQYFESKSIEYALLEDGEKITISLPNKEVSFGFHSDRDLRGIEGAHLEISTWRSLLCEDFDSARRFVKTVDHPQVKWRSESGDTFMRLLGCVFSLSDGELMDLIQEYVNHSASEPVSHDKPDSVTYLDLPVIDVMMKVFGGADEKTYQKAIYSAVQNHHEYWSQPRLNDSEHGYFSMQLTTLAKVAFARHGYRIGFETDYVPEAFYTRPLPTLSYDFLNKYTAQENG
ncbi:Imm49 family immunity protein [Vibrio parahaemolyticus]|uniref:Imm49 family immunity protein n=1 Tax=Vibrio parahaemolyticus TaxID=670 RepID=UPI00235F3CD0|nr:Imm49 family immunity protein [Vibrio parahaemolyticus]